MTNKHLFLFGGSPPFGKTLGKRFAHLSLRNKGKIAILFIERKGWKEYMRKYTKVLEENGATSFVCLPLSFNQTVKNINELVSCTGVIICGGETELYHKYIVDTEIGIQIKNLYKKGIPVSGFSAGALISPRNCVIPPIDNARREHLFLSGLGLLKDCVISVHFSKWNEEENIKTAISKTKASIGYGIDDDEGLYFRNEILLESEGEKFYVFKN